MDCPAVTETKRKKTVVTMRTRLEAISRMDKGEPLRRIAAEYNVGTSTVSDWKRNRKDIENFCAKMVSKDCLASRVTAKQANDKFLDYALYNWYTVERGTGYVSGPVLQAKALELNKELGGNPAFCASTGWLSRWKARHGIAFQGPGATGSRLAKSSGETSSTITYTVTTSATTTCGTTSSFTTTSLTTVSTTTTFSTTTTPSTLLYTSVYQHQPSTSGIATTSIIKEELDIDPTSFENNLGFEFENTYNNVDQLEAEYCEVRDSKRRRLHNSNDHVASTSHNNEDDDEEDGRDADSREPEESHVISETEEDVESRELSDLLETADTMDLKLNNTLTDNIFNFCNINPTPTRQRDKSSQPHPLRKSLSTAKLKLLDLEQRLRVYHLRSMIRKEEELMNIKIEVNKSQLVKEEMERENKRKAHLIKMENLNLENKLLRLQLQLMVK